MPSNSKYCLLYGNRETTAVSYYSFPKNKKLRNKWLSICRIDKDFLSTATKLCSDHFEKDDIIFKAKGSILKPNAVPYIFIKKRRIQVMNDAHLAHVTADVTISINNQSSNNVLKGKQYLDSNNVSLEENSSVNRPTTPSNSGHIELFQTPKKAVHVPRYVGDIRSPQLSTPKKAKRALDVAKRTIQRLRKKIKMLQ